LICFASHAGAVSLESVKPTFNNRKAPMPSGAVR